MGGLVYTRHVREAIYVRGPFFEVSFGGGKGGCKDYNDTAKKVRKDVNVDLGKELVCGGVCS